MRAPYRALAAAFGRVLVIVVCVLGVKLWASRELATMTEAGVGRRALSLGQDAALAVGLAGLVVAADRVRSRAWRAVLLGAVYGALLANAFLAAVLVTLRAFATFADPHPALRAVPRTIADHATTGAVAWFLAPAVAFWLVPAALERFARAPFERAARRARPAAAAAGALVVGGVIAAHFAPPPPRLRALLLDANPLVSYVAGILAPRRTLEPAPPADPDVIARALSAVAPIAAGDEPGLDALRGHPSNVVLVLLESIGAGAVGIGEPGHDDDHPFLSRLEREQAVFVRHSTPMPHSRNALASIFCSVLHPPSGYGGSIGRVLRACRPIAEVLGQGGVQSGFFQSTYYGDWIGKDFFDAFGFGTMLDASGVIERRRAEGRPVESREGILMEHETVTELLDWIGARCAAHEPFFGVYYSWVAHSPYPASHGGRFAVPADAPERARHRRLVRVLDEQIERIHAALARLDCGRPAALLVTGDHGEAFEEHAGNRFHTFYPYEENVHVPLVIAHPLLGPVHRDRVTSHVDLGPTIVDLARGDAGLAEVAAARGKRLAYQGRSLLRPAPRRPAFSVTLQGDGLQSIRWGRYKLIAGRSIAQLFDTDVDPGETVDVTAREPSLAAAMRTGLAGWAEWQGRRERGAR